MKWLQEDKMTDQSGQRVDVIAVSVADVRRQVAERWGWFLGLGIVFLVAGFASIAFPLLSTIAAKIALGWIFMVSGLFAILHSFSLREWGGFLLNLILGALYIFVGAYLAFFPFTGIITLTLLLAALFLAEGILQVVMALRVRPHEGWGWLFLSGCVAIGAGALIALGLPGSATWAIGLLVGINLLSTGFGFVLLALAGRRAKLRHGS
jgi:uncharacterized membrane protein HdeD (DUF308 family)